MRTLRVAVLIASLLDGCRPRDGSGDGAAVRTAPSEVPTAPDAGSAAEDTGPTDADGPRTLVEIASGDRHACGRSSEGDVFCWGANEHGQLGGSVPTSLGSIASPRRVPGMTHVVSLASERDVTCAVRGDGSLWCWGLQEYGAFGIGPKQSWAKPTAIAGVAAARQVVLAPSVGLVATAGPLLGWGMGAGPLGRRDATANPSMPSPIPGVTGALRIAAGIGAACAVVAGGSLVCWGTLGAPGPWSPDPAPVRGVTGAIDVVFGTKGGCVLKADGTVGCWGENDVGQLGVADRQPAKGIVRAHVSDVASLRMAGANVCAINRGGALLCWGAHQGGGDGPYQWPGIVRAASVGIGDGEICASTRDGGLWCAGYDAWRSPHAVAW